MPTLARRFDANPLVTPTMLKPSAPDMAVTCVFNPGAFQFDGKIWLLARVAERPKQKSGSVSFPIMKDGQVTVITFDRSDQYCPKDFTIIPLVNKGVR